MQQQKSSLESFTLEYVCSYSKSPRGQKTKKKPSMLRLEINHKKFNFFNLFLSQGTQGQNAHLKRMLDNS